MRRPSLLFMVLCALFALLASTSAPAQPLIANDSLSGTLYDVNPLTGAAGNARPTGVPYLVGLTFGPDGTLYGMGTFASGVFANSLIRIDPVTGAATRIGATGLIDIFEGDLDFDPVTGRLYGVQNVPGRGANRDLFEINPASGAASRIGTITQGGDLSAMAFDNAGRLFVLDTADTRLLQVDPATAAVIRATPIAQDWNQTAGMDFQPGTGVLFVAEGLTDQLYTLDTTRGAVQVVGPLGAGPDEVAGLRFVPEPGGAVLLALVAGLPLFRPRLRRARTTTVGRDAPAGQWVRAVPVAGHRFSTRTSSAGLFSSFGTGPPSSLPSGPTL